MYFLISKSDFIDQKRQENQFKGLHVNANVENEWIINEFADWLQGQVLLFLKKIQLLIKYILIYY